MPSRAGRRTRMAYREVRMMDIDQVMRRWLAGERIRAMARSTGLDRNTVRRLIRVGQQVGLKPGAAVRTRRSCSVYANVWGDRAQRVSKDQSNRHCFSGNPRFSHG